MSTHTLIFFSRPTLQLGTRAAEISEPSTPAESPTPLNQNIKGWLNDKLGESNTRFQGTLTVSTTFVNVTLEGHRIELTVQMHLKHH